MRDIRVTDDILTGPATDELLDDVFFMRWVDDDDLERRPPDAIDRFLARKALAEAEAEAEAGCDPHPDPEPDVVWDAGLPSAA